MEFYFGQTDEYFKGYKRGMRDTVFSENIVEYLNPYRVLFVSDQEIRDRERGYRSGRREGNNHKWEYNTGYNRGRQGSLSAQAPVEILDMNRALFMDEGEKQARQEGFDAGRRDKDRRRWNY